MKNGYVGKFFAALLLAATLLGALHHHDDLKKHADCLICTLQSNLASADHAVEAGPVTARHAAAPDASVPQTPQGAVFICLPFSRAPPLLSKHLSYT
ncbi:hypothetical protein [Hydrogenimonas sp.]